MTKILRRSQRIAASAGIVLPLAKQSIAVAVTEPSPTVAHDWQHTSIAINASHIWGHTSDPIIAVHDWGHTSDPIV